VGHGECKSPARGQKHYKVVEVYIEQEDYPNAIKTLERLKEEYPNSRNII